MEKIPIMSKHKLEIKDLFDEKGELKLNIQKNQGLITFAEGVFQYVISPEDLNEDLIRHLSQLVQTTNLYHAEKIKHNTIIDDAFLKLYHPISPITQSISFGTNERFYVSTTCHATTMARECYTLP